MSIWGKVVGGMAGFALGGPLGAILGALAGHMVDRAAGSGLVQQAGQRIDMEARRLAFSTAVVVLGAKMAKADGHVTKDEIRAFREVFHVPPESVKSVGRLFDEAKKEATGFEPYARQVAEMFRDEPAVLEELLGALFHIARADGRIDPAERAFLREVASIFGLGEAAFARIDAEAEGPQAKDPYAVLGLAASASDEEVKQAWRQLTRENHPDRLMAQGLPQEFVDLANERMATINAAYDRIAKQRGMK